MGFTVVSRASQRVVQMFQLEAVVGHTRQEGTLKRVPRQWDVVSTNRAKRGLARTAAQVHAHFPALLAGLGYNRGRYGPVRGVTSIAVLEPSHFRR